MFTKFVCSLKSKVFTANDMRIAFALLGATIIILGGPSDGGGLGG